MDRIDAFLSHPRRSNLLVGLIIFFSTTQLGLHFWPLSSLVYGIRIDYLSPTIYFLDFLIILHLTLTKLRSLPACAGRRDSRRVIVTSAIIVMRTVLAGIVVPILLTNLLFSANPLATLSWSLHFLLYLLFLETVLDRRPKQGSSRDAEGERTILVGTLRFALTLTLLFQAILSIAQVLLGHSLGGLLYWLGERAVSVGSPAIALATFTGQVVLRAYGTFGHPNVLAGWSVVCLLILIQISQTATPKVSKQRVIRGSDPLKISWLCQTLWVLTTILIVFLTQSRAAALALFGLIIPFYLIRKLKLRLLYYFITLLLYCSVFPPLLSPPRSDLSLKERLDLQGQSLQVTAQYPLFGSGAQASISIYPSITPNFRLLQPDHNSFTLFFSWFGLFGVIAILFPQFRSLPACAGRRDSRRVIGTFVSPLAPLLPLLLLDHYLLTSPQGLFILLLYLKLAVNYPHAHQNL